jgi:hypothetical protein
LWSCLEIELYSFCQKTDYDWYAQQPLWFCYLIQQRSTLSCFFSCITIFLYDLYIVWVLSEPNFNSLIKVSVSRCSKLWKVKLCSPEHRLHSYPTPNNYCNLKSLEMEHIFSYNCSKSYSSLKHLVQFCKLLKSQQTAYCIIGSTLYAKFKPVTTKIRNVPWSCQKNEFSVHTVMPGWTLKSTLGCCSSYICKTVSDKRSSKGNSSMAPTYQLLPEFNLILMVEVEWNELGTKLILNYRAKLLLSGLCKKPKLANLSWSVCQIPKAKTDFVITLLKSFFNDLKII